MNANDLIFSFDLGKASIGEAVRAGTEFKHVASLLIPQDFAETKSAANRRRMWRTREAHKAREAWLERIWRAAGFTPLAKRRWNKEKKRFDPEDSDYRLKREFPPAEFERDPETDKRKRIEYPDGQAKNDGAPAAKPEHFRICYTSSLLRIKLLRGDTDLQEWQIYKALHAAIQKRGYERVLWASAEDEKKEQEELEKTDPKFRQTIMAWDTFLRDVIDANQLSREHYGVPCYYDAWRIGMWLPNYPEHVGYWNPEADEKLPSHGSFRTCHEAKSARNIRFPRKDLEREFLRLVLNADRLLQGKLENARATLLDIFKAERLKRIEQINERRRAKNETLPPEKQKPYRALPKFEHLAPDAAEYLLYGPTGCPPEDVRTTFARYLQFRRQAGLRPGTEDDWQAAFGQKIPRFDNRIVEQCALIPRLNVCKAAAKPSPHSAMPDPDSLLHCEVQFLMKLKNVRVMPNVRPLTPEQIAELLQMKREELAGLLLDPKKPADAKKLAKCFSFGKAQWKKIGQQRGFEFKPHPEHAEIILSCPLPSTVDGFAEAFRKRLSEIRVLRAESMEALTAEQIGTLLELKREELRAISLDRDDPRYAERIAKVYAFESETGWAEVGEREDFGFWPAPNHQKIEPPKHAGRSRLSRPALKIMRELILSGHSGPAFRERLLRRDDPELLKRLGTRSRQNENTLIRPVEIFEDSADPKINEQNGRKGLLVSDLDFLTKMRKADGTGATWEDLFIPNEKLDRLVDELQDDGSGAALSAARLQTMQRDHCALTARKGCRVCASERAINKLIGSQNDPIVRQRLRFFWERLKALEKMPGLDGKPMGEPARIVLEFAREDFLGKKAKEDWKKFNEKKRELNERAAKRGGNHREQLKFKLWLDQGGECVYGVPIKITKEADCVYTQRGLPSPGTPGWEMLEIDHIVPQSQGGPDAYINYVLTFGEIANGPKRDMTPYEWFSRDRKKELDGYINFVRSKLETKDQAGLSRKKIALLTRPDAKELVQRYTALAETAWISRLAQTIIRLHFGWPLDHQVGTERVLTLTGGQTAQFRREFRLNTLLGVNARVDATVEQISKQQEEKAAIEIQDALMDEKKKNRVDPRHHALDAMVLTLIPEWRHFQAKRRERWLARITRRDPNTAVLNRPTPFFDHHIQANNGKQSVDSNAIRRQIADELRTTHAEFIAFERPRLEETHYGKRTVEAEINKPLDELAFTNLHESEKRFDEQKLRRWTKRCTDDKQRAALETFIKNSPSAEAWEGFKAGNRKLFRSAKVHVRAPEQAVRYTRRALLRLLVYDMNKSEWQFEPEYVREDIERIEVHRPGMAALKIAVRDYVAGNPSVSHEAFGAWLKQRCQQLVGKDVIYLSPLASENEEPESKRKSQSVNSDRFGRRKVEMRFDHRRILKQFPKVIDPFVRNALANQFQISGEGTKATSREFTRDEWERFCDGLRKPARNGRVGPRVLKVTLLVGRAADEEDDELAAAAAEEGPVVTGTERDGAMSRDEFKMSTKSPHAYLKGAAHKGYFLYLDENGDARRRPVFAHESIQAARAAFANEKSRLSALPNSKFHEIDFLQTGCQVELSQPTSGQVRLGTGEQRRIVSLAAGIYRLNTFKDNGRMKLTTQNGQTADAPASVFVEAGIRRLTRKRA